MRFMIIVKATADTEAGVLADDALYAEMAAYHEALAQAGALLDAAGLQPSSAGWRIRYANGQRKVIDGPFADTRTLVAGYTVIQARSREEALEWTRRFPAPGPGTETEIEVRPLYEIDELARTKPSARRFHALALR
ncbi:YciI family protein [Bordetella petrii]|uniref:YciI family protein n=1 Tax=Bordetella petrii TaxID=94624 RepID=UPI001E3FB347|nr:YciI family protein [Bordetella petrii]MCD0505926.1 YciI family protein [Bordetella petrii]